MSNEVSIESAQKLKEAGIEFPKSEKAWVLLDGEPEWKLIYCKDILNCESMLIRYFLAPNIAELLDVMPKNKIRNEINIIFSEKRKRIIVQCRTSTQSGLLEFGAEHLPDALTEMILFLNKEGLIK
jgi:rhodanese-related sulfurtransferase